MNNLNATTILKSDYKDDITLKESLKLAIKVVAKTIDTHEPKPNRFEIAYLTKEDDKLVQKTLSDEEVQQFLDELKQEQEANDGNN